MARGEKKPAYRLSSLHAHSDGEHGVTGLGYQTPL